MTTEDHLDLMIADVATSAASRSVLRSIRSQVTMLTDGLHRMSSHAQALAAECAALRTLCAQHGLSAQADVAKYQDSPPPRPWDEAAFAEGKAEGLAAASAGQ